jgi:hypothetical protein
MKKWIYPLLFWMALSSACSSPNPSQSTPSIQASPLPSMTIMSTPKPISTATASLPTDTAALPSPISTDTSTPSPTHPPAGIFAVNFYPPLVLDYPTEQWLDKSEYDNTQMMVNYLQNKELKTCTIGPMGPSGFYPENMQDVTLGNITYQRLLDQKTNTGNLVSYYFALSSSVGSIENEVGIAHFDVQSSPAEAKECRVASEEVLTTLRRTDQPK